jgi:ribonuclease HI
MLQVDGAMGRGRSGIAGLGLVVRGPWGQVLTWRGERARALTCNEAEYQALIAGLRLMLRRYPGARVRCMSDSRVVIEQMLGRAAVHAGPLLPLHARAMALARQFAQIQFVAIPRALNRLADALAWEALGGRHGILLATRDAPTL